MSNNEAMNSSIKAKLTEANKGYGVFPAFFGIDTACWDTHAKFIMGETIVKSGSRAHDLVLEMYRSLPLTDDELRYIHENLSTEAFSKLGLKLPINCLKADSIEYDTIPTNLPEKKLEYTIPTDLSAEVVAWLKASVEAGECQVCADFGGFDCHHTCNKWTNRNKNTEKCGWDEQVRTTRPEFLEMFKTILDAQLPPLNYTVPDLDAEEREHVTTLTELLADSCGKTTIRCTNCTPLMKRIFGERRCYIKNHRLNSPERAQFIDALKDVLKQQKPLLPPHNVIQFSKEERKEWKWWLGCDSPSSTCPRQHKVCRNSDLCKPIFPELYTPAAPEMCPCNNYPKEAVRTIIEQCIALGPKFEEYDIWMKRDGEIRHIISESDFHMFDAEGGLLLKVATDMYTRTPPPPKEEFQPYVAVRLSETNEGTPAGSVVLLTKNADSMHIDTTHYMHSLRELLPITNPLECRDMLNEVLGEESMVKAIKAHCEERIKYWKASSDIAMGKDFRGIYRCVMNKIADLERKAKK